ncbi:uncharacterized protein A4U43_C04F16950 [Asparagus officinalis]|uniref:Uncharacterized protein n=1 Tax=Asparagus officinalis TaxID=4686 RepID=A0A5P1F463_ASPOF|nr:uncharacterized protein A4U43_C04F16950 [Asparagus officinalis]
MYLKLRDAISLPPVEIPPSHVVEDVTATVPVPEAKVVIVANRSPIREEGAQIYVVETEEAEASAKGEVVIDMSAELAHRQGKEPTAEGWPSTQGFR